jgi:phosphoenolpyruvate carboxylase
LDFVAHCRECLGRAAARSADEPDVNPVRALAYDVSRRLESGETTVDVVASAAKSVCDAALRRRAARLAAYAQPVDLAAALARAAGGDAARLKELAGRPRAGVVFTAHPTFAMSERLRTALAALADDPEDAAAGAVLAEAAHAPDPDITVETEHRETQGAIARAQDALREAHRAVLEHLRDLDPGGWRSFTPRLATLASWVGYDFDGRTDIHWSDTIRFRIVEKATQLRRYEAAGRAVGGASEPLAAFIGAVARAAARAEEEAARFAGVAGDPAATVDAANGLTRADDRRLVSAAPLIGMLDAAIAEAGDAEVEAIWLLRADVASFGLGSAEVHLRVNASQVRNAARADFDIDPDVAGLGRVALSRAAEYAEAMELQRISFASVYLEQATARRQLMLAAQIRKHVDADAPIRFLIAETESPVTVLAAIALARRYGVADGVDISPLFETPEGLEGGGRLMEQLIDEPAYLAYARARGRAAIQIGFSDSGRYMGQLAAGFAAERLQILLARALARRDIRDLEVVVFNTHGESMGRGAHPGGMAERLRYVLTPWTAARFARERIRLTHETSFQGGDGLLHFGTGALAARAVSVVIAERLSPAEPSEADGFYADLNFSWDFYRALKSWHERLREHPDYAAVLAGLGRNLLFKTGSRPVKRSGPASPDAPTRALRAIPHNAILQQFAAPANIACGVGRAADIDPDRFLDLAERSERAAAALGMAGVARGLMSLAVLRAYAGLFDPTFWSARAFHGSEPELRAPAAALADRLKAQRRTGAYARLANLFAADLTRFDELGERVPGLSAARASRAAEQEDLELLHGLRLALLMEACLLAARLPPFADRFDVTREGLIDLVLDGEIEEAAGLLDLIFPAGGEAETKLVGVDEPTDGLGDAARGYAETHRRIVSPLRRLLRAAREIGVGVSHAYDAYG